MDKKEWLEKIEKLGKRLCPLMITEVGRFEPELCVCDIPKTRVLFLMTETFCYSSNSRCLPRGTHLDEAQKELNPRPYYIQKSAHF
jgi:hypothetical protein